MSNLLNGLARVGPKRLVTYLARLVPAEPHGLLINFDLTCETPEDFRKVEQALYVWCGLVVRHERFGPGASLPSWTVRFFRRSSAEQFLKRFGLLDAGETVDDYIVKEGR